MLDSFSQQLKFKALQVLVFSVFLFPLFFSHRHLSQVLDEAYSKVHIWLSKTLKQRKNNIKKKNHFLTFGLAWKIGKENQI